MEKNINLELKEAVAAPVSYLEDVVRFSPPEPVSREAMPVYAMAFLCVR